MMTGLRCTRIASPNHGKRRAGVDMLVLHYTGMPNAEGAIARLTDPRSEVSSHYLIDNGGEIFTLVREDRRAWHAGQSSWHGQKDLNSRSIGIEIAHPGHDGGNPPFPSAQIDAVIALCRDITSRWPIRPARVLAHSDIAPSRKQDPGERFPWQQLHRAGIGNFVAPAPVSDGPRRLVRAMTGLKVEELQRLLGGVWVCDRSHGLLRRADAQRGRGLSASFPARARGRHRRRLDARDPARIASPRLGPP